MIRYLSILGCFILFIFNTQAQTKTAPKKKQTKKTTKTSTTAPGVKELQVKLIVEYTNTYCGGARPTPEIQAEYNKKKKLTGTVLSFVDEKTPNAKGKLGKTNENGEISIALAPGTYLIMMTKFYNKKLGLNYDPSCKKMMQKAYGKLTISAQMPSTYKVPIQFPCNPCLPPRE